MKDELISLRDSIADQVNAHKRTPENVANLALGLKYLLKFASDSGVLTADEQAGTGPAAWTLFVRRV